MKCYLGVDIGSVSTKFVLIDQQSNVLYTNYFRTEGDPIRAIKDGLKRLESFIETEKEKEDIDISGVATTGSGRYLAKAVLGADLVKNEITAHARGVTHFVPEARTVIEIGGQDSKIIILENGVAVDFAMNLLCLKGNTRITTNPSYTSKPIKEIRTGQRVLTHKGRFKPVGQVFERKYQGDMIKIEISNLKKLEVTPEHPVLALKREDIRYYQGYSRNSIAVYKPLEGGNHNKGREKYEKNSWEPRFIPAKDLREGDLIATPLPPGEQTDNPLSVDYSPIKTGPKFRPFREINKFILQPDTLRLLGYYLAQGHILYNRSRYPSGVSFTFSINEGDYIEEVKDIVSKNFKNLDIRTKKIPEHNAFVASIHSKSLAEFISYLCGSTADKKKLSPELLRLEPERQKEILKGFFRGDRYSASTLSENLAHQLYWLLLRNKIKCRLRKSSSKTNDGGHAYFIEVFGKEIDKLEDRPMVNPQKQGHKSFIYKNWLFEPIRKIKKYNFNGMVYNLNVKDDHSYVAGFVGVHNCAAGTGSFLDAQAYRLGIPIEKFGEIALRSKNPTTIASRCTVFAESDMIHKQQIGHKTEDIVAGLCQGMARNYLSGVGRGKKILPPIVFLGGVSENVGMRLAFKKELGEELVVPKYNTVMGALGAAILVKDNPPEKTKFRGFKISEMDIKTTSFICKGCPNYCEVIEARIEGKVKARWGDRCGKWSNLNYN